MPWSYYNFLSFSHLLRFLSHFLLYYCHLFSLTSISVIIYICWPYESSIFMRCDHMHEVGRGTDSGKEWNYASGTGSPPEVNRFFPLVARSNHSTYRVSIKSADYCWHIHTYKPDRLHNLLQLITIMYILPVLCLYSINSQFMVFRLLYALA